jgi:hypothetical protein
MTQTTEQRILELEDKLELAYSQLRHDNTRIYKLEQWIKLPWIKQLYTPKPFTVYKRK